LSAIAEVLNPLDKSSREEEEEEKEEKEEEEKRQFTARTLNLSLCHRIMDLIEVERVEKTNCSLI